METMVIRVLKNADWLITRKSLEESRTEGKSYTVAGFGVSRIYSGKIAKIADEVIDAERIKKAAEFAPFGEEVHFEIVIDREPMKDEAFTGTIIDGLLWLLNRKEEYGL